eukprot:g13781.t1
MFVNKKDKIHLDHCWIVDLITSRQIDLLGLVVGQVPTLAPAATPGPGQILVTTAEPTTSESGELGAPVVGIPIGDLGGGEGGYQGPQTVPPDPAAGAVDVTVIVAIAAGGFFCIAVVMLGVAMWTGVCKRKPTRVSDLVFVETPPPNVATNNCPLPGSRASSRTSCGTGSRPVQERSASRRSSGASNVVYSNQVAGGPFYGPFYDPQSVQAGSRSASRRSSNASNVVYTNQVAGPFYDPQQSQQLEGRSASRRSSNAPACGPFHNPELELPGAVVYGGSRSAE